MVGKAKFPTMNLDKAEKSLETLKVLSNPLRYKIYEIVLKAYKEKKQMSMSDIHKELLKHKVEVANKNCVDHIRQMEAVNLLKLKKVKYSKGQKIIVEPTPESFDLINWLNGLEKVFGLTSS